MRRFTMKLQSIKAVFLASLMFGSATAHAAIEIANTPLQTGSSVPPNIMFIIDDSGSMHFEVMPEDIRKNDDVGPTYIFPRLSSITYGSSVNVRNTVPSFRFGADAASDNERVTAARYRSSTFNTVYYDPAVTYKPWSNADGSGAFVALNGGGNVDPKNAYIHPTRTTLGSWDLTIDQRASAFWVTCSSNLASSCTRTNSETRTFFPAVYYYYNGGDSRAVSSYEQVEIREINAPFIGHGRENRTDCNAGTCSYDQEIQNFANWHTYHRSRLLTSQGGIGSAFSRQSPKMRVGFGTLNKASSLVDGVATRSIVRGVRDFDGADRAIFFDELYKRTYPFLGTPLLSALNAAGTYYSREDSKGPWGLNPGSGNESTTDHISCRQSFSILMTDGYWSDADADVISNNVGDQDSNFGVTIMRPDGDTGANYRYEPASPFKDNRNKTLADIAMKFWKNDLRTNLDNRVPTSSINPAFWQHMVTFGVSLGLAGSIDPDEAFGAISSEATINWPAPEGFTSSKIDDLLHASVNGRGGFFSASKPDEFAAKLDRTLTAIIERVASASNLAGTTTSMQADNFVYQGSFNSGDWSGTLKSFNINDVAAPVWESNFPAEADRNILFGKRNGTAAAFTSGNVDTDANALSGKASLVKYLRGDRENETGDDAEFRRRVSVLGDIANSSPAYVAKPVNRNYNRYTWDGAADYRDYLAANENREPVIYVGANDGMLHAFNGTTGTEIMAYVPQQMLTADADLAAYASKDYQHRYYVDGSPLVADAFINGSWRSVLLGSLGRGGDSLFAIDVTNPASIASGDTSKVLWDKRFPELGITTNKPVIARLNNGKWAAVVGYGYNNSADTAGLLVIDLANGEVLKKLEAAGGSSNGMGQIEGWDNNGDGITDWFFGGDIKGNIWKFDLASATPATWKVAYDGMPLFTARDAAGERQSVTGGVSLSSQPTTGHLWLFFGTGKMLSAEDPLLSDPNSWYGIRDGIKINDRSELKQREIVAQEDNARVMEFNAPFDMDGLRGWYIDLGDESERIVNRPQVLGNSLVVNTITPGDNDCNPQGSGWVMAVNPYTGGRLGYMFFDRNGDGLINDEDGLNVDGGAGDSENTPVSGLRFDGMPSEPVAFNDGETTTLVIGLTDTRIADVEVDGGILRGRVSWRELTNQ